MNAIMDRRARTRARTDPRTLAAAVVVVGTGLGLTACGTSGAEDHAGSHQAGSGHHAGSDQRAGASAPLGVSARTGTLAVTGAYVPVPASPDVAAAYFTVRNDGDAADTLSAVRSDVSTDTGLHGYSSPGRMVDLPALPIPAHGQAALKVGSTHVMIMNPTKALTAGTTVRLTLTFTRAGALTMSVPVVAATGPVDSMPSDMDMPGMHTGGHG